MPRPWRVDRHGAHRIEEWGPREGESTAGDGVVPVSTNRPRASALGCGREASYRPTTVPIHAGLLCRSDASLDLLVDRAELAEVAAYHVVEYLIAVDDGVRALLEHRVVVATVVHEVVGGHPVVHRRVERLARSRHGDGGHAAARRQVRIVGEA